MGQSAGKLLTAAVPTIGKLVQMFQCFIFYDKKMNWKVNLKLCIITLEYKNDCDKYKVSFEWLSDSSWIVTRNQQAADLPAICLKRFED